VLSSTKAVCDPVAMLSRSVGSRMEDVCATTGNDRQSDRSADHFVSPKMMANNRQNVVVKCNAEVVAMGPVSGNVQEIPNYGNIKENIFLTVVITCKTSLYIVSDLFVNYYRFLALSSPPLAHSCRVW
jgi:hypothetical protein